MPDVPSIQVRGEHEKRREGKFVEVIIYQYLSHLSCAETQNPTMLGLVMEC